MRKFYTIVKGENNLPEAFRFLKWLRVNANQFEERIPMPNTHSPFNKIISMGFIRKEFKENVFAVKPDENNCVQYAEIFFKSLSLTKPRLEGRNTIISKNSPSVTTIHNYIDSNPITRNCTRLIVGTIHPHLIEMFLIDFFYGNVGSIWKILSEAFPHINFGDLNHIIQTLKEHNIAITDIIRQCDRENEKVTEDSKLFNIIPNHNQILNGLMNSEIDTIYFTSGFGKNNAAKLFLQTFKIKVVFDPLIREFTIPAKYFRREIRCVVLYSPSGAANRGIARSRLYLKNKLNFQRFEHPIAEFKRHFYLEKFSFLNNN